MRGYRWIGVVLAVVLAAPPTVQAQARERREAVERLMEAQQQLADALRELERAADEEARRALRRALDNLRAAERELSGGRMDEVITRLERLGPAGAVVWAGERPRMGVVLRGGAPERDSVGAEIMAVTPGGPADEAGLAVGDVIVRANGEALARRGRREESASDKLVRIIRGLESGDTLRVAYRRGGETRTAAVVVRELEPRAWGFAFADSGLAGIGREFHIEVPRVRIRSDLAEMTPQIRALLPLRWLDIELVELDDELGRYFGTAEGLLVVRAPRDEALGLRGGDVILRLDGRQPTSPSHAMRILRSYAPGETLAIEIMRERRRQTLTVTVPEREGGFYWGSERERR